MALKLDKLSNRKRLGSDKAKDLSKEIKEHTDLQHYEWSEMMFMPISFFKDNPSNVIFEQIKNSPENKVRFQTLKEDIKQVGIHEPILATGEGLILSGHSRISIARELEAEGTPLGKIPVLMLESKITEEDMDRIIVSCNVNRFQTDFNMRLIQMAKIAPHYFSNKVIGQAPKTVSGEKAELEETFSISPAQVKREKQVYMLAYEIAAGKGKEILGLDDIEDARDQLLKKRKESDRKKKNTPVKKANEEILQKIWKKLVKNYKGKPHGKEVITGLSEFLELAQKEGLIKGIDVKHLKF